MNESSQVDSTRLMDVAFTVSGGLYGLVRDKINDLHQSGALQGQMPRGVLLTGVAIDLANDTIKLSFAVASGNEREAAKAAVSAVTGAAGTYIGGSVGTSLMPLNYKPLGALIGLGVGSMLSDQLSDWLFDTYIWPKGAALPTNVSGGGISLGVNLYSSAPASTAEALPSISTPADTPTRNSANYITDTSASDHAVVVRAGGTVWDAYVFQKNAAGGVSDWSEFKAAVAASNPHIGDLNNLAAGATLYMPERMSDGSITYNFAGGTSINNNATTGAYHMLVQNSEGGQTVYSRTPDLDAGYMVKQVQTDRTGNVVSDYLGYQQSLTGDIRPISSSWETPTEAGHTSWGVDGSYTTHTTNTATQVETVKSFTGDGVLNGVSQTQAAPSNVSTTDALSGMFLSWREQLGQLDDAVAEVSEKRLPSEYIVAGKTFEYVRQTRPPGRTIGSRPMLFLSWRT